MSLDPIFALRNGFDPKLHLNQIEGFHLDFEDGVDIDMNVDPEVEFD